MHISFCQDQIKKPILPSDTVYKKFLDTFRKYAQENIISFHGLSTDLQFDNIFPATYHKFTFLSL